MQLDAINNVSIYFRCPVQDDDIENLGPGHVRPVLRRSVDALNQLKAPESQWPGKTPCTVNIYSSFRTNSSSHVSRRSEREWANVARIKPINSTVNNIHPKPSSCSLLVRRKGMRTTNHGDWRRQCVFGNGDVYSKWLTRKSKSIYGRVPNLIKYRSTPMAANKFKLCGEVRNNSVSDRSDQRWRIRFRRNGRCE